MRAKEYLQQLRRLDTVIDQKIKELDDLKVKSTCIGGFDYSKKVSFKKIRGHRKRDEIGCPLLRVKKKKTKRVQSVAATRVRANKNRK